MFRRILAQLLLLIAFYAQAQPTLSDKVPVGLPPKVRYGVLPNGLRYYVAKHDTASRKVHVAFVCRVGAYNFRDSSCFGIAHFIEHLGFQKTLNFPNGIRNELRKIGLRSGTDFGASTDESTDYWVTFPSRDSAFLRKGLQVLYDWAGGRVYEQEQIEEERLAIQNEMERGNNPAFQQFIQLPYLMFDKNPLYQPRFVQEFHNISTVSLERLRQFEETWYRPDLQAIFVVGDIDDVQVEESVKKIYSSIRPKHENVEALPDLARFKIELPGKQKVIPLSRQQDKVRVTLMQLCASGTTKSLDKKQLLIERLLDDLYNELAKTRLNEALKDDNLDYSALITYIDKNAINPLAGVDAVVTQIEATNTQAAKKVFTQANVELHRIATWGFTENELIAAKESLLKRASMALKRRDARRFLSALQSHFISGTLVLEHTVAEYDSVLKTIKIGQVNENTRRWLSLHKDISITIDFPNQESACKFDDASLLRIFNETRSKKPARYKEPIKKSVTLVSIPDTSNYSIEVLSRIDAMRIKLGNGATVLLKRIGSSGSNYGRSKDIEICGYREGGIESFVEGDKDAASMAPVLVAASGIGGLTRNELSNWLGTKNRIGTLGVVPYIDYNTAGIVGEASQNNVEDLFNLIYLYFSEPSKDERVFDDLKNRNTYKYQKRNFADSVRFAINDAIGKTEHRPTDRATFRRSSDIYRGITAKASEYTFVITGHFEFDYLVPLVKKYLGAIKNQNIKAFDRIRQRRDGDTAALSDCELRATMIGDSVGTASVRLIFAGCNLEEDKDQLALELLNEVIKTKLHERLRGKEGLVYSVVSTLAVNRSNGRFALDLDFETTPVNIERAITCVVEELSTLSIDKFEDGLLIAAKRVVKERIERDSIDKSSWNSYIKTKLLTGMPLTDFSEELEIVSDITREDIVVAAKKFLNPTEYSIFKLL